MSRRTRILIALAAGLGILLLIGVALSMRGKGGTDQDDIAAELGHNPKSRLWVVPLRTYYPRDYRMLLDRLAAARLSGGSAAVERVTENFIDGFMSRKANAIASAPDERLRDIASALADLMRRLRNRDLMSCAQYFRGGRTEDTPSRPTTGWSRIVGLQIEAAHAGETGGRRPRGRLSAADSAAWISRFTELEPQVVRVMRNTPMAALGPELRCRAAIAMFQAMADQPPPVGASLVVEHLVRGAARPR